MEPRMDTVDRGKVRSERCRVETPLVPTVTVHHRGAEDTKELKYNKITEKKGRQEKTIKEKQR